MNALVDKRLKSDKDNCRRCRREFQKSKNGNMRCKRPIDCAGSDNYHAGGTKNRQGSNQDRGNWEEQLSNYHTHTTPELGRSSSLLLAKPWGYAAKPWRTARGMVVESVRVHMESERQETSEQQLLRLLVKAVGFECEERLMYPNLPQNPASSTESAVQPFMLLQLASKRFASDAIATRSFIVFQSVFSNILFLGADFPAERQNFKDALFQNYFVSDCCCVFNMPPMAQSSLLWLTHEHKQRHFVETL